MAEQAKKEEAKSVGTALTSDKLVGDITEKVAAIQIAKDDKEELKKVANEDENEADSKEVKPKHEKLSEVDDAAEVVTTQHVLYLTSECRAG